MAVFSERGAQHHLPRCDALTQAGLRCQLRGKFQDNGRTLCVHHRLGGTRLRSIKTQEVPKEVRFIATYTNGIDLRRGDVVAVDRESAYQIALDRTPHKFKLFNLRQKKEEK